MAENENRNFRVTLDFVVEPWRQVVAVSQVQRLGG